MNVSDADKRWRKEWEYKKNPFTFSQSHVKVPTQFMCIIRWMTSSLFTDKNTPNCCLALTRGLSFSCSSLQLISISQRLKLFNMWNVIRALTIWRNVIRLDYNGIPFGIAWWVTQTIIVQQICMVARFWFCGYCSMLTGLWFNPPQKFKCTNFRAYWGYCFKNIVYVHLWQKKYI